MRPEAVACIDIGKTNRRVLLIDARSGAELARRSEANAPHRGGPYPALDLEAITGFVALSLAAFAPLAEIRKVAISAHGAAFVAMAGDRPALPALDYEAEGPNHLAGYPRPPYAETFSPALPGGLNAGRGLYWLARTYPDKFAEVDAILALNQYLAFWLCGVRVTECTALGCHTDLWNQSGQHLSSLVEALGWTGLFPPLVRPGTPLGPVRATLARQLGLPRDCLVLCGIHDSNATLVPYLGTRQTVFATGTWIVAFSLGGGLGGLDETRDCLANADYRGRPVPSARMMGGREFALLAGEDAPPALPARLTPEDIPLPSLVPGCGPFARQEGHRPTGWEARPPTERSGLASLYCAFCCAVMERLVDGSGPATFEGVFARNPVFLGAFAQLSRAGTVQTSSDATGTIGGLAVLAGLDHAPDLHPAPAPDLPDLQPLFAAWLERAEGS